MKFLLRSHWGEGLPIAYRLQDEGNEVQVFIGAKEAKTAGDGLVRKAVDLGRGISWSDVVIYDSNVYELPDEAEKVRIVRPVIGSSALAGRFENDRMFALGQARQCGLPVSESVKSFSGPNAWTQARSFLKGAGDDQAFVWKPNGEAPVQTYVSDDLRELERMLVFWRDLYVAHHEEPSFILTPRIEGVEVSTEGWWDGSRFSLHNHTIERNRLMAQDLGEKTGCMGNVVWAADGPSDKLVERLIEPLGKLLGNKYKGPVDINAIIEEESNEPVFLEFTPRFGYDAIYAFLELCKDFGKVLSDCAKGQLGDWQGEAAPFSAAYRITIPPFPEEPAKQDEKKAVGVPIFGVSTSKPDRAVHLVEVRLNGKDELETSGPGGFVMVISGTGASPAEAMKAAFKNGKSIKVPQMRWRCDLDSVIQEVFDDLEKTGFLKSASARSQVVTIFGQSIRSSLRAF